jgi:hypothetical protein
MSSILKAETEHKMKTMFYKYDNFPLTEENYIHRLL